MARRSTLRCANTSTCSGAEPAFHANPRRPGVGFGVTLDSAAAGFVLMAVVMAFAATPAFRFLDHAPEQGARYAAVDGLRGFLALGVFLTHLFLTHRFIETGLWEPPTSRLYALLGAVGVSAFFMLTGFLFWGKLLRSRGRPARTGAGPDSMPNPRRSNPVTDRSCVKARAVSHGISLRNPG